MIKASAGGGGKGMRIAHSDAEVRDGFARARSEAKSSFGDDRVFIEKFIVNPRHIEIQVLGDKHGNVIHLGERECSIQRRNQKVIEEAPSPLLDAKTRKAMGEQAVALAKAVNYDSAGTVEFVAGQDRSFFFLEMNTRLQVEHPVTELVTGIDLVEQMIRVAAGEKLAITQKDVKLEGLGDRKPHLCRGSLPQFPALDRAAREISSAAESAAEDGVTLRNDTGVYRGRRDLDLLRSDDRQALHPCADRATAIARHGGGARSNSIIDGIQHNMPFLSAIMENARWQTGTLSTGFIAEEFPGGFTGNRADARPAATGLLGVAVAADHIDNRRKRRIGGQMNGKAVKFSAERVVKLGEEWSAGRSSTPKRQRHPASSSRMAKMHRGRQRLDAGRSRVWRGRDRRQAGRRCRCAAFSMATGCRITASRVDAHVFSRARRSLPGSCRRRSAADTSKKLLCPMPGLVVSITVRPKARR